MSDEEFPIDELVRRVGHTLVQAGVRQTNGQVSEAPTERTVRYYRTRGLLDPPAGHRGRVALYASRHVLQVLAIKRLQAHDVPLHEIQQRLVGRADAELAAIAGVQPAMVERPEGLPSVRGHDAAEAPSPAVRDANFWTDRPAAPSPGGGGAAPLRHRIAGVQLPTGVRLTFPATRDLTEADLAALIAAAGEVLACLQERHLVPELRDVTERTTP
jgi:DNA-binding transcriptional MerR regulator